MTKTKISKKYRWNPSARNPIEFDDPDFDYIRKTIQEVGIKLAKEEDKAMLIVLMGLIRKKLRDDPTFARKLRELLGLDRVYLTKKKTKILWVSDT